MGDGDVQGLERTVGCMLIKSPSVKAADAVS